MTIATELRVAVLGAGYFSRFHLESWAAMADVSLVGVADHDPDKASATGMANFTDLETMLTATRPDLLDIVVPPTGHADAIGIALAHGVRWIICQKPFCTSLAEARAVTDAAEAAGATVVIHENFRFQPWYRAIKASIAAGDLGEVRQATFRLRPGDGRGPRAYLDRQPYFQTMPRFLVHETAVHWIDTFRYLFGPPEAVYADLRRINPAIAGEDAGVILFDHPGGVRAIFDGNRHLDHAADNLRRTMGEALIEGTEATLTLTGDGAVRRRAFGASDLTEVLAPDTSSTFGGGCVNALQSHVVSAILQGTALENPARDYLRVIEIEEAIYASARTGQKTRVTQT